MTDAPVKVLLVDDDEDDYVITRDLISQIRERRYQLEWVNSYDGGDARHPSARNTISACWITVWANGRDWNCCANRSR